MAKYRNELLNLLREEYDKAIKQIDKEVKGHIEDGHDMRAVFCARDAQASVFQVQEILSDLYENLTLFGYRILQKHKSPRLDEFPKKLANPFDRLNPVIPPLVRDIEKEHPDMWSEGNFIDEWQQEMHVGKKE
ncbi:MAG: hypothetical protein P8L37_03705, partial [Phycisphaerales bacterium]|nr:hypothetical protein [Phycisphaerales bacterium]